MALLSKQGIEMNGGCCLKQGQGSEGHALVAHHTPTVGSCDKLTATKLVAGCCNGCPKTKEMRVVLECSNIAATSLTSQV